MIQKESKSRDYQLVRNAQVRQNETGEIAERAARLDPTRIIGATDYRKFDEIANELDKEETRADIEKIRADASTWCKVDHIHGPQCKKYIPGCSHDRSNERRIFEKPFEEKIQAVKMFREEGNEKYKNRDYEASAGEYTRALMYLDYTFGESEEQSDLVDIERFKCHLNLAAVYLELGLHRKAVNEGRIAISLNSKSCKAYYRRGVAHLRLGELDEAQKDLYYAMKLARESAMNDFSGIEDAIRELNVKWRKYRNDSVMISKAAIR